MHPFMSHVVAELRSIELRKQADYSRLVASCSRPTAPAHHGRLVRARRALGVRLIRVGLRLTTTHR
ncbi:MAG TPA: hypothetical protein VGL92_13890 [Acidimicrobiia bacterium]|jgi:hypothetical protein